jgi:hypothetical protein
MVESWQQIPILIYTLAFSVCLPLYRIFFYPSYDYFILIIKSSLSSNYPKSLIFFLAWAYTFIKLIFLYKRLNKTVNNNVFYLCNVWLSEHFLGYIRANVCPFYIQTAAQWMEVGRYWSRIIGCFNMITIVCLLRSSHLSFNSQLPECWIQPSTHCNLFS